jgi:pimeloyl-ACP methyl ester carboxylesterase
MRPFSAPRWTRCLQVSRMALVVCAMFASPLLAQAQGKERPMEHPTFYRTIQIDGLSIFYREAGPKDAPTILLLHGLPSSSRMFEPLFARLFDRYHMVAPDYPGFGHSDWPDPKKFAYTFDHIAEIMNHFTEALGLSRYTLYMQDYGGPVGFRMVLAHPDRVEALIVVQDAVAHNTGLGGELEDAASLLGRSRRQRKRVAHKPLVARGGARAPCGGRSKHRTP